MFRVFQVALRLWKREMGDSMMPRYNLVRLFDGSHLPRAEILDIAYRLTA